MNRRLAVPIVVKCERHLGGSSTVRARALKGCESDPKDLEIARKIADNQRRLDRLLEDLDKDFEIFDADDVSGELDYIEASVKLGLLEITGELEETPWSDELVEEAAA